MRTMSWLGVFVTVNLIGIGSNLDNCGTGIAYGSERIRIPHRVNGVINVIGFGTALVGAYLGRVISADIPINEAEWVACVVLVTIGLYFWYAKYVRPSTVPDHVVTDIPEPGWKQGVLLGFALSFTNVAIGFGATVAGAAGIWTSALSIAVWGYIMIWLGNVIGIGLLAKLLGKYSSFFAGLLLIAVGVHQVAGGFL